MTKDKIILYRVVLKGKIAPIEVYNTSNERKDKDSIISINNNIKDSKLRIEVESKGKGFRWSSRWIFLPNRTVLWRSSIKYHFFNTDDYTNIKMPGADEWINLIEGPQRVRLIGFTGYINFRPGFLWGETTIHGYALRIEWDSAK